MRARSFYVAAVFVALGGLLGACSSGSGGTPTFQSPPGQGPVTLGGLPANIPYSNASASGYVSIPAGISIPSGDGVNVVVQASPLPGVPTLASVARHPSSLPSGSSVVVYYGVTFSQTTTLAGGIGFQFVPPSGVNLSSGQFYIGEYDPTAASPTWTYPILGPGLVSGTPPSLQFSGLPGSTSFVGGKQYGFALYEITGGALTATPASASVQIGAAQNVAVSEANYTGTFTAVSSNPSIATVTPASGAGPFTITGASVGSTNVTFTDVNHHGIVVPVTVTAAPLVVTPTTLAFTAAGQVLTSTVSEASYTGAFTAVSSATSVATVTVSGGTISVTAVAAGTATITVSDSYGQTQTINVGVTTTGGVIQ